MRPSGGTRLSQVPQTSTQDWNPYLPPVERTKIVAGIPAFNEEPTIGDIVRRARAFADEIVVVDDGSRDRTSQMAAEAGAFVIRHDENRGYGAAIRSCLSYARNNGTKALVILDGDGQHPAEAIPTVLEPVVRGAADVSIGSRFLEPSAWNDLPRYRRFGIRLLTFLTNLAIEHNGPIRDAQSGFRAFSRRAIEAIDAREDGMGASVEILWEADGRRLKIVEVPVNIRYFLGTMATNPVEHGLSVIGSMIRSRRRRRTSSFIGRAHSTGDGDNAR